MLFTRNLSVPICSQYFSRYGYPARCPLHLQDMVKIHLESAKEERLCAKHGAQIALLKTVVERRQALARIPLPLQAKIECYARKLFEQLKRKR